jgi:hypothetical protein
MEESQKLPKPRLTQAVKTSIKNILKERMSRYATLLEVKKVALLFFFKEKNILNKVFFFFHKTGRYCSA